MRPIELVVLHHSAMDPSTPGEEIDRLHRAKGWDGIGYHFYIHQKDGEWVVFEGRPIDKVGAHCKGHNSRSIGVCVGGNYVASLPPQEALEVLYALQGSLKTKFPLAVFRRHKDFNATACPGQLVWK